MPGRPSTTSLMESPTGCTKQLISVACRFTPAAELIRPAGMKPSSCACRKRRSHWARSASRSTWARARATRRRTWVTLCSPSLAYFSSSVSRLMSCSETGDGSWISMVLNDYTVGGKPASGPAKLRDGPEKLAGDGGGSRGFAVGQAGGGGAARHLQPVGDLGVAEAQRELDRRVAFPGRH